MVVEYLNTLRDEVAAKSIYIWDTSRKAMWVFCELALRGVRIEGFVTNFDEYVGDTIMGLPIVSLDEFSTMENAVAIVDDDVREGAFNVVASRGCALYFSDALELNPGLLGKAPYIYGIGDQGWWMANKLSEAGVKTASGFIVRWHPQYSSILGVPVYMYKKAPLGANDAVVITAESDRHIMDNVTSLLEVGFCGTIYVEGLLPHFSFWGSNLVIVLDKALKEHRQLLLCCGDDASHGLIQRMLSAYGISASREVLLTFSDQSAGEDIWELADEDPDRSTLIIGAFSNKQRFGMLKAAHDLGYSSEWINCVTLQLTAHNELLLNHVVEYEYDLQLESSIDYSLLGGKPGWAVHGNEAEASVRIAVVGGSTSTELYFPESWVKKLYRLLEADGIKAVIFNAANEGNGVTKETLRLMRDIHALKPDFVISMSGVNDQRKQENKFEQLHGDNPFDYWRRAQKYMKLIVEEEGAEYIGILQPMNACMRPTSLFETMYFMSENHKWGKTFLAGMRDDDFYFNFLDLFHHQEGKYTDRAHYSDEGNRIIAEQVYRLLKERM